VSAGELGGIVNLSELAPEALTEVSSSGVAAPARIPVASPDWPAMSVAESNPTQRTTPGAAQRALKSPGGATPPVPAEPELPTEPPLPAEPDDPELPAEPEFPDDPPLASDFPPLPPELVEPPVPASCVPPVPFPGFELLSSELHAKTTAAATSAP
jgi:hypothetical protein